MAEHDADGVGGGDAEGAGLDERLRRPRNPELACHRPPIEDINAAAHRRHRRRWRNRASAAGVVVVVLVGALGGRAWQAEHATTVLFDSTPTTTEARSPADSTVPTDAQPAAPTTSGAGGQAPDTEASAHVAEPTGRAPGLAASAGDAASTTSTRPSKVATTTTSTWVKPDESPPDWLTVGRMAFGEDHAGTHVEWLEGGGQKVIFYVKRRASVVRPTTLFDWPVIEVTYSWDELLAFEARAKDPVSREQMASRGVRLWTTLFVRRNEIGLGIDVPNPGPERTTSVVQEVLGPGPWVIYIDGVMPSRSSE